MARLLPDGSGTQNRQIYVQKLKSVLADNSNNGLQHDLVYGSAPGLS